MIDLRADLAFILNQADNGGEREKQTALDVLRDRRWELYHAHHAFESIKVALGLYSLSTRDAAEVMPTLVREIMQGTVNGTLLLRAVRAERELAALKGKP